MSLVIVEDPLATVTENHAFAWVLEWQAEKDYAPLSEAVLFCGHLRAFLTWRWTALKMEDGEVVFQVRGRQELNEIIQRNRSRKILVARLTEGIRRGEKRRLTITAVPPVHIGNVPPIILKVCSEGRETANEGTVTLDYRAGTPSRFVVCARPSAETSGKIRVVAQPEDCFGNPASFSRPVDIVYSTGRIPEVVLQEKARHIFELAPPGEEIFRVEARVPRKSLSGDEKIENARVEGEELLILSNPVQPEGVDGELAVFGEIHWHTNISLDGWRTLEEAFTAARDVFNLDFSAPGDHKAGGEKWKRTTEAVRRFYEADRFVTFFGFEQGVGRGHVNIYSPEARCRLNPDTVPEGEIDNYLDDFPEEDFIVVPHHTNAVALTKHDDGTPWWVPYKWGKPHPRLRLVEILQGRGNFECDRIDEHWHILYEGNGASVQDALTSGHKIGFTGGTDNHSGWPTLLYGEPYFRMFKGRMPYHSYALTGMWAKSRSREDIFEALKKRHTWACMNTRAIVRFTVNGALQGDEIVLEKPTELAAKVNISAEAPLETVEIISDKKTVWQASPKSMEVDLDVSLGRAERNTYFYLRARQENGAIMYASPVFII